MSKKKISFDNWQTILSVCILIGAILYLFVSYYFGEMSPMKAGTLLIMAVLVVLLLLPNIKGKS